MSQPEKWTPASGARVLRERFGTETAAKLLTEILAGMQPADLIAGNYAEAIHLIGNAHADTVLARWRTDLSAPRLDHWPRSWAARAFAYLGDRTAGPVLAEALEDEHWWVRKTAIQSLGRLGVTDFEPALRRALRDPHKRVRRVSATALGRVGTDASLEALRAALDDDDLEVRAEADKALSAVAARRKGS